MQAKPLNRLGATIVVFFTLSLILASATPFEDQYVKVGATGSGSSWDDAGGSIQAAIDAAGSGDVIYVAQGTYFTAVTLQSETQLFGGYEGLSGFPGTRDVEAYPTIIDGSTARGGEPAYHVVTMDDITTTTLDGFTITGGFVEQKFFYHNDILIIEGEEDGGGIYCVNYNSAILISNCIISANSAMGAGGGVYCHGSNLIFSNCAIKDNMSASNQIAGGGICCIESKLSLTNSTISDNFGGWGGGLAFSKCAPQITHSSIIGNTARGFGGGIYCTGADPEITSCLIGNNSANFGAGIAFANGHITPIIRHCVIKGNSAASGGGLSIESGVSPILWNCFIIDNSADSRGGGITCSVGASATIVNCTIAGNSANRGGGVCGNNISFFGTELKIDFKNTIFYRNSNYALYESDTDSDYHVTNCLFAHNPDGDYYDEGAIAYSSASEINANMAEAHDNIDADPQFVDALGGDYHLRPDSPCIDAGTSVSLTTDFEGDPRPYDATSELRGDGSDFDIGADEFIGLALDTEALYGGFVDQQYRDFLYREAERGGHNYYIEQLRRGAMTPEIIVRNFMDSPEFANRHSFLARCYFGLFNDNSTMEYNHPGYRIPDSGGLSYWHSEMQKLASPSEYDAKLFVVYGFMGSAEWGGRDLGLSDEEYVEMLYHRILGRASDAAGMAHHLTALTNGWLTREELALFFLESAEAKYYYQRHTYITMAYLALLQRAPERGGFLFHMQRMGEASFDVLAFLRNIINSPEYHNRLTALGIYFPGG